MKTLDTSTLGPIHLPLVGEDDEIVEAMAKAMAGGGLFEHISGKWGVIWRAEQLPDEYQFRSDAIAHIDRLRARAALTAHRNYKGE